MYRCGKCGESTKAGESIRRVVVKTRQKDYPARAYRLRGKFAREVHDPGGFGHEAVRELAVCGRCEFNMTVDPG